MMWLRDGAFQKAVLIQELIVLLLLLSTTGQLSSTTLPVVALVGEDVLLPCRLESASDALSMIVEWGRPDLKPRFVHVWHKGQHLLVNQNPSYKNRTSLSTEKLNQGDLSLTLFTVKLSDSGTYRCFIPELNRESIVKLIVGAVSSPFISGINVSNSVGVLQCESKGWYPQPEVMWLDSERNLLSAGPTETLRGPDGLFTVSSRLTVEKTNRDSFTCRVHQEKINQTRETHIQISGFMDSDECPSSPAAHISITLVVISICALAVFLLVWKSKQNKKETMMNLLHENEEPRQREHLMSNTESKEDTEETKKELEEKLKREKQRKKDFELVVQTLKSQTQELEKVTKELEKHTKEMERRRAETGKKVESVERKTKSDKAKGFIELKEIILRDGEDDIKQNLEQLGLLTEKLHFQANKVLQEMNIEASDNQKNQCETREDKKH